MSGMPAIWAASLGLISATLAVTRPNVVHALMWLVAALVSIAAAFFAFGADFAGAVQVLIYAGAILAVFVFVVMTVDASREAMALERRRLRAAWRLPTLVIVLVLLPLMLGLSGSLVGAGTPGTVTVTVQQLGTMLFGPWSIAVEAAGFLLMAALLGARRLSRRDHRSGEGKPH
ncbi:NADH-quinone oxidoreductase subunit J [Aestuariivirga sp.]|uniref:NADH-quinone oxidoreductase subunit J family protein n=1 Tax=Aestuariivirga sp. TaxID=2650926 RepID=UPI0035B0720F